MSTAAAFLECDPKPECPIEDTYSFGSGGTNKDGSNEKVNKDNIVDKVKATNIPSGDALKAGSFGISEAGAAEALTNRIENQTGIPANLPEGSFGITPKKKFNIPKINKDN